MKKKTLIMSKKIKEEKNTVDLKNQAQNEKK